MLTGQTIVLLSAVPWSGLYARPQHLATRFASLGARVIFVEPAGSFLSPLKQRGIPKFSSMRREEPNIAVLTPPLLLPAGYGWSPINRLNQALLWRSICSAAHKLGWEADMVWTHLPGTADLPTDLPLVYDCVDDHAAFSQISYLWSCEVVKRLEHKLLQRAWRVFASSELLLSKCRQVRKDAALVGNGADMDHFAAATQGYSNIIDVSHPIVGFYGGIGTWIDLELVADAAVSRPDLNFVMIGPVDSAVKLPARAANLHFLGFVPYQALPQYLADFDVALVPFKNSEVTQSVNPLKLYEYFAAGKPVIVADIPELARWQPLVYVANTAAGLLNEIDKALKESEILTIARQKVAQENSWDAKVADILRLLGE
ncbi:MAG: hypothetical protein FD169_1429 [Bacillota bacterium]|nr:MAG: hypothetical protein FD169_1429 [Bacillota bacterium]